MALVGIPLGIYLLTEVVQLFDQFWPHRQMIGRLGFIERWIQPLNHRVHHAQNDIYLDKNYAGVFPIWDHLFGSFQEELDATLHLRHPRATKELEPGVGQPALLLGDGQGLLARRVLDGQDGSRIRVGVRRMWPCVF